jgi:6,7-dimethyl-8-ribityllumazine synthase
MLIGVVTAKFNSEITFELERGAIRALKEGGFTDHQIWAIRVPGAVEIPLAAKALFNQGCDAVVTLGAVIRGETAHFDYVCQSVERGVTQLMLEVGKPIGFGVLTTENEDQAFARTIGHHGNKGAEAAVTALEMLELMGQIKKGPPHKSKRSVQSKSSVPGKNRGPKASPKLQRPKKTSSSSKATQKAKSRK